MKEPLITPEFLRGVLWAADEIAKDASIYREAKMRNAAYLGAMADAENMLRASAERGATQGRMGHYAELMHGNL